MRISKNTQITTLAKLLQEGNHTQGNPFVLEKPMCFLSHLNILGIKANVSIILAVKIIVEEEMPILIDAQGNSMSVDCLTIKKITHLIWVVFRRYHK